MQEKSQLTAHPAHSACSSHVNKIKKTNYCKLRITRVRHAKITHLQFIACQINDIRQIVAWKMQNRRPQSDEVLKIQFKEDYEVVAICLPQLQNA